MFKKRFFAVGLVLGCLTGTWTLARADFRYYAWTYQFLTMPPGETELEIYTRLDEPKKSDPATAKWKRQLEIETGLTKKWDVSIYLVDSYKASDAKSKFDEYKLRTRYKLAAKDSLPINPLLYVEYKIQTDRTYPDKWEAKLILVKDIGRLNVAINIIPEEYYLSGTRTKGWKTEYAAGMSYPASGDFARIGFEIKGDLKDDKHLAGPVISFRGRSIWASAGFVFGLNPKSDEFQMQAIVGILP